MELNFVPLMVRLVSFSFDIPNSLRDDIRACDTRTMGLGFRASTPTTVETRGAIRTRAPHLKVARGGFRSN